MPIPLPSQIEQLGKSIPGIRTPGNINLAARPVVRNADGSISTVRSMSFQDQVGGPEILIPTVSDEGKLLSNDAAIGLYRQTGKHLGMFDTPDNATRYAQALHQSQAQQYAQPPATPSLLDRLKSLMR